MWTTKTSDIAQRKMVVELGRGGTQKGWREGKKITKQKCLLSVFFVLDLLGML